MVKIPVKQSWIHLKSLASIKNSLIKLNSFLTADSSLIFVCGAAPNKKNPCGRDQLMEYAKKHLKDYKFFIAEDFFKIYQKGERIDFLTIENNIAKYCDCIIILLESESAFTELGAFSNNKHLIKIILAINEVKYKNSKSFISLGPLAKIDQKSKFKPVVQTQLKSVVQRASDINERLSKIKRSKRTRIELKTFSNFKKLQPKVRMLFILDLITLYYPITFQELIRILSFIYGDRHYRINTEVSLLITLGLVYKIDDYFVRSLEDKKLFFSYIGLDNNSLRSDIINYYHKYSPQKISILRKRIKDYL